jgi:DNA-directed RNA polymerase specialized sigma24 family protein
MKYFEFTKKDYDYIVQECMLDEEYQKLLEYKIRGYSRTKIADLLHVSVDTLDKMIQKLKKKIKKII